MDSNDGRPIGVPHMTQFDYEKWLARYSTPDEIQKAANNCHAWIDSCNKGYNPLERVRGVEHWQYRLELLRTKALIMGISLEK